MKTLEFIGDYIYNNDMLTPVKSVQSIDVKDSPVYEIIKIISGVPLFYESHLKRLHKSLELVNLKADITKETLLYKVKELCKANNIYFGNIELVIYRDKNNTISHLGFIKHSYPEPMSYIEGVSVGVISAERDMPNAKIKNTETRQKANTFLSNNNFYEVLLVDKNNKITEGSRSNFFYIKGDIVYTAPESVVLSGITRKYIIEILKKIGVQLIEKMLFIDDVKSIDAALLCGTSPGILPIKNINNYNLNVENNILRRLILEFNSYVKEYIIEIQ